MLPIYKRAVDLLETVSGKKTEQAEQPVSQEYRDHLVNQSFDWAAMAAKHQFMEGYRIGLAEMREKCAKVCEEKRIQMNYSEAPYNQCAAAIRAIKFEGDTGFRPVSEMIAEHKQDPKKAAAIEKAKMRKAEQKPVPTGATHYQPHQKTYYKRVSATEWYLWSCTGKGWLPSKGTSDSSEWIMLSPIQAHQPAKPEEQEPVAFEAWWADTGEQSLYALNTTTDDDIKTIAGIAWEAAIRGLK